ncbi:MULTISPECIES: hypothetical protein [unclassified Rhodococcus (in: high G+C Gram-positive bacteria)]|jgi:hypothetical protein|uniref:hypothetical protein n=1 Tax=unclassified Rhodococcus (in: high G+C Gram-positive bacteria) TaxID=192944 RepID=UPI0012F6361C|nr:hypothetical protein [Rhodococcus sp. DK17]
MRRVQRCSCSSRNWGLEKGAVIPDAEASQAVAAVVALVADRWLVLLIGTAFVVWLIALVLILYAAMTLD